jgi:hypothetical protein
VIVLSSDSVESLREPSETRVAVSLAGVVSPRELLSKTIVGLAAVEALAEVGMAVRLARANRLVRKTAVLFLNSVIILKLRTLAMGFPSIIRYLGAESNSRPTTQKS